MRTKPARVLLGVAACGLVSAVVFLLVLILFAQCLQWLAQRDPERDMYALAGVGYVLVIAVALCAGAGTLKLVTRTYDLLPAIAAVLVAAPASMVLALWLDDYFSGAADSLSEQSQLILTALAAPFVGIAVVWLGRVLERSLSRPRVEPDASELGDRG